MSAHVEPVSSGNSLLTSIFTNKPEIAKVDTTLVDTTLVDNTGLPKSGFIGSIINKFTTNKKYLYIGIAVIILAGAVYYYYLKHKKLMLTKNKIDKTEKIDTLNDKSQKEKFTVLNTNGKPLEVDNSDENNQIILLKKQLQSLQQQQTLQQQALQQREQLLNQQAMQQQQLMQQQATQATQANRQFKEPVLNKQVLQHPNEESSENTDNDSDEINAKIASIQAKENSNVSKQNLTNSEIEEINKKLEQMKQ